jgi:hypothetical protein
MNDWTEFTQEAIMAYVSTLQTAIRKQEQEIWKLQHPNGTICPMTGHRETNDPGEKTLGDVFKTPYGDGNYERDGDKMNITYRWGPVTTDPDLETAAQEIRARKLANRARAKKAKAKLKKRKR